MITRIAKVILVLFIMDLVYYCLIDFKLDGTTTKEAFKHRLDQVDREDFRFALAKERRKKLAESHGKFIAPIENKMVTKKTKIRAAFDKPQNVAPKTKKKVKVRKKWKRRTLGAQKRVNFGSMDAWVENSTYKKVILWTGYGPPHEENSLWTRIFGSIVRGECPESRCTFTTNKSLETQQNADAVLFHMPNIHWEGYKLPEVRHPHQNWIFMTYESATNVRWRSRETSKKVGDRYLIGKKYPKIIWPKLNNIFNRTLSFRSDADATVYHGYFEKLHRDGMNKAEIPKWTIKFDNYTQDNFNKGSNAEIAPVIWFVSHCKSESGRDRYVRKLQKHIGVHIYGKCGTKQCGKDRRIRNPYEVDKDPCFDLVSNEYKFYLSLENDLCTDYITEKAFNALNLNTVPIILSGANLTARLPPGSVIDALQFTPEELATHLYRLLRSPDKYQAHFHWRQKYRVVSYHSVPSPCSLCQAIHSPAWHHPNTYANMADWFVHKANCTSWDGKS